MKNIFLDDEFLISRNDEDEIKFVSLKKGRKLTVTNKSLYYFLNEMFDDGFENLKARDIKFNDNGKLRMYALLVVKLLNIIEKEDK